MFRFKVRKLQQYCRLLRASGLARGQARSLEEAPQRPVAVAEGGMPRPTEACMDVTV